MKPTNARIASAHDHVVRLGPKALLIEQRGHRAAGVIAEMARVEFDALYADQPHYREQAVQVETRDGELFAALTMVHRQPPLEARLDPTYAAQWTALTERLGFSAVASVPDS